MEHQAQDQWCWAALAVSVATFYGTDGGPSGNWQQCDLATAFSQRLAGQQENCCPPGAAPDCDKSFDLNPALERVNHSGGGAIKGVCSYNFLQGEIDGNRPVAVRIGWDEGGPQGHFILLTSYDDEMGEMVRVEDPQYGPSDVPFEQLRGSHYREFGSWTHYYPVT
jgi:hypothetical protein